MFLFFFSFSAMADLCICQYPKEDAKYGGGEKIEVPLYQLGCKVWLAQAKKCRKRKTININTPLDEYLDANLESGDRIRLGYVGHWSSSKEIIEYLEGLVEPLRQKYRKPVVIENTACSSMDDPELIQKYVNNLKDKENSYLNIVGTQTTSIGMWDKVSFAFRKADLVAEVDSRRTTPKYPSCSEYKDRRCTGFQEGEIGLCSDSQNKNRELICVGRFKKDKYGHVKLKKAKRWIDIEESRVNIETYIKQEERELKYLMHKLGYEVMYGTNMVDSAKKKSK